MGRKQLRTGDISQNNKDNHGNADCPHNVTGPALLGSSDIIVNDENAMRTGDLGVHVACCGLNQWRCVEGSKTVIFNNKYAARKDDQTLHCGGLGNSKMGSSDVLVGGPTINILSESRNNAIRMLQNCQEALERWNADDQARFREWFGTTDETARQTIRDRTTREIAAIQEDSNEDFRLLEPAHNNPNYGAYVYGSRTENRQVFLGSYFNYSATPDGGQDSQSSMIVHEYSHFDNIGNTVDHAYGRNACRNLAQTDSTRALENADNFENWADSVYNNQ